MTAVVAKVLAILIVIETVASRIHRLPLTDDERHYVDLTTFGFYQGGILDVHVINFVLPSGPVYGEYGFTLDRTLNDAINPYLESHSDTCIFKGFEKNRTHHGTVFLRMDFKNLRMNITCEGEILALHLYQNKSMIPIENEHPNSSQMLTTPDNEKIKDVPKNQCSNAEIQITKETRNGFDFYNTSFAMYVASTHEEGLYNVYFHYCPQNTGPVIPTNAVIEIFETNKYSFLSAGEMPLPAIYSMMSLMFFMSAFLWTTLLKISIHKVYKIHYIMCVLVYLKAISLAFHGINYHFIQTKGEHVTAWAILYYITHLLKGAVLFVTIVLVGTGWNFIKHILADRDKKIFMIVIPLQVVSNVAEIIIAESEEGAVEHNAWRILFILVDMLCCGAIMFPVVWSIHHLEDSSTTDGKAAVNLRKLKLFRHFYIMILCYIYFTRFIVTILENTVPFQLTWVDEMFREMATFVFFVTTGYKFRPAAANPYFTPAQLEDDEAQVLSEIGVLEGLTNREKRREDMQPLLLDNSD
ncbi:protein GPR107 [Bicyclus anynana]|uniref:Protein GPR107 n=1 Tax=Bicyclus anynana TaxID=110368 RepID=A0A6J1NZY9_BICAN|nr:protein GPR107 [Bicyclus anynana]